MASKSKRQAKIRAAAAQADRIVVAYLSPGQVSHYFCQSLVNMLMYDQATARRVVGCPNDFSSANVSGSRNRLVADFLDNYDAEWLLFIDSDMMFPHNSLDRLLLSADKDERPIVGGLCFGIDRGNLFPTLYVFEDSDAGPVTARVSDFPENTVIPVAATGAAFLLIHRRVLKAFRERGFSNAFPFFQESELSGLAAGEDITFCLRAGTLGFPIHVDTGLHIGHHKSHVLTHEMFRAQKPAAPQEAPRVGSDD